MQVQQTLSDWGLEIDPERVQVPGRVFANERLVLGNRKIEQLGKSSDWMRVVNSNPYAHTVDLKSWVVLYPNDMQKEVGRFVDQMLQVARGMRFPLTPPEM